MHGNIIYSWKLRDGFQSAFNMLLTTPELLRILVEYGNELCFIDGTHNVCEQRMQLVLLVVKHHTGEYCLLHTCKQICLLFFLGHGIPVAIQISDSHTDDTYKYMVKKLHKATKGKWMPRQMMSDFEHSILLGVRRVFPNIKQLCCYFHWKQAIRHYAKGMLARLDLFHFHFFFSYIFIYDYILKNMCKKLKK